MSPIVQRAQQAVEDVAHARSRRAFLAALERFERVLALAPDYPPGCLSSHDGEMLGSLADLVVAHVEQRLAHHTDRAAVQRALAARVSQICADLVSVRQAAVEADGDASAGAAKVTVGPAPPAHQRR